MGDNYTSEERRSELSVRVRDLEETSRNIQKSLPRVHERIGEVKVSIDKLDKKLDCFTENCTAHRVETATVKAAHKGLESFVKWSTGIYYAVSAVIAGILWGRK